MAIKDFPKMVNVHLRTGHLMLVGLAVCLGMAWAEEEPRVVSADEFTQELTRGIDIAPPITTSTGYAVPEASQHISLTTIRFDLDSARLRPEAIQQLNEVATALKSDALRDFRLLVEGHTCSLGTLEYNQGLSERRADAVQEYLIQQGIELHRLETKGWGEIRPVASNSSERSRRRNRRVDFIKLESASLPPVTRSVRTITPEETTHKQYLKVDFVGQRNGSVESFPLRERSVVLHSGDKFQISFTVLEGCRIYVLFLSSQGEVVWLFPEEDVEYGRWRYFGEVHSLPSDDQWYALDGHTGTEVAYLIASHDPLPHADALPSILKQHGAALTIETLSAATTVSNIELHMLVIAHE